MTNSPTISINFDDELGVLFDVPSSSEKGVIYKTHVWFDGMEWFCNCPGFRYRHNCKHVQVCKNILEAGGVV